MSLLRDEDKKILTKEFEAFTNDIELLFFSKDEGCQYCNETRQIVQELEGLSERITIKEIPIDSDGVAKNTYNIENAPAIVVTDTKQTTSGVRFFGIPSGYEFMSLIGAIMDVGKGETELAPVTKEKIGKISEPVHIQVFVTPTCPHCPGAVRVAHQMARLNPNITADMVEATEFPELSQKYRVMGVPKSIINGKHAIEGAVPEHLVLEHIENALNGQSAAATTGGLA